MVYRTRSERHQKKRTLDKKFNKKTVLSLVGTGLVIAPTTAALLPQESYAEEYQPSENEASYLINQIGTSAQQIADSNDLYASVMIAQALLESGNGNSSLSSSPTYNLFGVKAYGQEPSTWMSTKEYVDGEWETMDEPFRVYNSYEESLQDHAAVLKASSYSSGAPNYEGTWKSQTSSYTDATAYLTGRYATDPDYGQKLNALIEAYNLTQFDTPAQAGNTTESIQETEVSAESESTSEKTQTSSNTGSTYTVQQGDTLWDIAQNQGISLDELMANNGLTDQMVTVGQQLNV
ncbi:glucosaminidase domain-containing protein [Tetragenococcus halophilus]|uniref:glucosaminidase domain-containing protein n=1 Tax=Tetragenococcus halophilus TaxID=51669 RepID=UPI00255F5D8D|nr:glucosaminidase domain-containing protein [Tetragenococcus halophilus]GMG63107.1 glucosaminidase domain-containing protein [Tetragenococcus halophilus]